MAELSTPNSVIDVLLTTEGTYPVVRGGVSTWCDMLVQGVPGTRYHIYSVVAHPYLPNRYTLPPAARLLRVPMWGTEEPTEHLDLPYSLVYERKLRTTEPVLRRDFLPIFDRLMHMVLDPNPDGLAFGHLIYELYQWFQQHDYLEAMKSLTVWDFYADGLREDRWARPASDPSLQDAVSALGWLYRFLVVLNTPVPRTDVTHASASAFAGLPCILAKLANKTPYLLTEHGVYLREQYLSAGRSQMSPFAKQFFIGLVRAVSLANYAHADLIAPVAAFNARWERRYGVPEERIRIIYNGVDPVLFAPRPRPAGAPPTVVSVARIDPIKDIFTLIRAAAHVREHVPDVKFVVYGSVSVPAYYERCLALRDELGLQESFIFAGHLDDVPGAYASGDVAVLSSVSEGFPYAVVEAMMSGRPVIATDVGGTREACGDAGVLVEPQNPALMAGKIVELLRDPGLRASLAEEGRERALAFFTIKRNVALYRTAYEDLMHVAHPAAETEVAAAVQMPARDTRMDDRPLPELLDSRRQLALDRGQALQAIGRHAEAIREFQLAAGLEPGGPATPALLLTIAELYLRRGDLARSRQELQRAEILTRLLEARRAS